MTRWGFRSLFALMLACVLGGVWLVLYAVAVPDVTSMACSEWLAHPRPGHFRLTDCTLDLAHSQRAFDAYPWRREGRPDGAFVEIARRTDGPRLFALSRDPVVLARVERLDDLDVERRGRTLERHARELRVRGAVEGEIVPASQRFYDALGFEPHFPHRFDYLRDYVMAPRDPERGDEGLIAFGVVLVLVFGPLAILLFVLQRRWRRRTAVILRARSGSSEPRVF